MALIPDGFRNSSLRLQHLPFSNDDLVEPPMPWLPQSPAFIVYGRDDEMPAWTAPNASYCRHATYQTSRDNVMLFGPSHLVDERGAWNLEADGRPEQYLRFYDSDNYRHIFKGAKPAVTDSQQEPGFQISFDAVNDESIISFDKPVFLATPVEPDNWGRWVSTVVPKVFQYTHSKQQVKYSILCRAAKAWQRKLLFFLGADPNLLIEHDPGRTYFCSQVVTATYSAADITPTETELTVYREIAGLCLRGRHRTGSRIFVSRAGRSAAAPGYRVLQNEADLVSRMKGLGFDVIEPETLDFPEQVLRFSSADVVVGLGGAGLFNVLFCRPGTKVVTIEAGPVFVGGHTRMFAAAGMQYGIVFGSPDSTDPAPIHKRWSVDIEKVIGAVRRFM